MSENQSFSDVFRGFSIGTLPGNGVILNKRVAAGSKLIHTQGHLRNDNIILIILTHCSSIFVAEFENL